MDSFMVRRMQEEDQRRVAITWARVVAGQRRGVPVPFLLLVTDHGELAPAVLAVLNIAARPSPPTPPTLPLSTHLSTSCRPLFETTLLPNILMAHKVKIAARLRPRLPGLLLSNPIRINISNLFLVSRGGR